MTDDLFQRAREAVQIADICGVTLTRVGRRQRGECPLCGASRGKKGDGAFCVDPDRKSWQCFACDKHGDVVDLHFELTRFASLKEAAEDLVGRPVDVRRAAKPIAPRPPADLANPVPKWVERISAEARPLLGSPAAAYLASRGIRGEIVEAASAHGKLRFHPRVPFLWDEDKRQWSAFFPAMVATVETPRAPTGGIHCTYLDRTGPGGAWGKAAVAPAKKMHGPQRDELGPGGCWLVPPDAASPGVLTVAEGIESAFSAAILTHGNGGVLAALSLNRLQGGWLLDKWGRLNGDMPSGDPEKPALTWPGIAAVQIAVDRDMGVIRVKSRLPMGGSWQRPLSADERARICGGLAEQAWRRAGTNRVRVIAPGAGRDFNDELIARGGA